MVELLIALAILVTVSATTLLVFRGVIKAWGSGQLKTERYQQARLLFDVFERELSSAVANPRYPLVGVGPGEPSVAHEGVAVSAELAFVGNLPGRSGLVERVYWATSAGVFMCHDDESGDGNYATGDAEICGREVLNFAVAYFDGAQWLPRWDGAPTGRLPKAVRIALTIGKQKPESFETIIHVPTS
ncbi:MAG: hypothetical protein HY737_08075 [Candidatus Omnitrophica bacterium]|nr:hypothetical protein [Candidatus Omnitrophota bacterium]